MDPEQRLLKQLTVEDAAEANIVFSSLMGTRVKSLMCTIVVTSELKNTLMLCSVDYQDS